MSSQDLIAAMKIILPTNFVAKESDAKLSAYLNLCLGDVNLQVPQTNYTIDTIPPAWTQLIIFGATIYANLFLQVNYSLKDFTYSDYGLSLNVDRQGKLEKVYAQQLKAYDRMKWEAKKTEALHIGPMGVGYPRYQSQIGQFLKTIYGPAYNWQTTAN